MAKSKSRKIKAKPKRKSKPRSEPFTGPITEQLKQELESVKIKTPGLKPQLQQFANEINSLSIRITALERLTGKLQIILDAFK